MKNKEGKMAHYRHGDISFHPVTSVPAMAKKETRTSYIVAYGEATGHHHELNRGVSELPTASDKPQPKITVYTCDDGRRFVELDYRTPLDHPEHGLLTLEKGIYEIYEERERDPFENALRKVID